MQAFANRRQHNGDVLADHARSSKPDIPPRGPDCSIPGGLPAVLGEMAEQMRPAGTDVRKRLEILAGPPRQAEPSFAQDVASGLGSDPKRLPSKYFYDELGSALFDAITLLPEYYLTRAETQILNEWGWEIVRALGNPTAFVELGSGSAVKTRILIEEALRVQRSLRYSPIDISGEALRASAQSLVDRYPALTVTAYAADY